MSKNGELIACPACDLLHRRRPLRDGQKARCTRCGTTLYQQKRDSLDRTLAFTFASLVLFVMANSFTFMTLTIQGKSQENTLMSGVIQLFKWNMWEVATAVLLASIVIPAVKILGMLYVLVPLKLNRLPWKLGPVLRWMETLKAWGMIEVYMLGVIVAVTKLAQLADFVPGIALFSFVALMIINTAAEASLDIRIAWDRIEIKRKQRMAAT
jgi:paraquat-inducible protein A